MRGVDCCMNMVDGHMGCAEGLEIWLDQARTKTVGWLGLSRSCFFAPRVWGPHGGGMAPGCLFVVQREPECMHADS